MNYAVSTGRIAFNPLSDITKAFIKVKPTPNPAVAPDRLPWLLNIIIDGEMKRITRSLIRE